MNFIRYFLVVMLFAVTGTNVMADDYDDLGGKKGKFADVARNLGLVHTVDDSYELTLSTTVYNKLLKVEAVQFSNIEKIDNKGSKLPLAQNAVALVKDIYTALEAAAAHGSGRSDPKAAARLWLGTAAESDRKITLSFANYGVKETLASDNAAVQGTLANKVKWDLLESRKTAELLNELNGTVGAKRPATVGKDKYDNAQAAYDAYAQALALRATDETRAYVAARLALTQADALRFGPRGDRTLEYLADKEKATYTTAEMRAKRDKAKAKASKGGGLTPEGQVAVDFFEAFLTEIDAGRLAALKTLPEASALDFSDVDSLRTASQSNQLLKALIASAKQQRALITEISIIRQQIIDAQDAAALAIAEAVRKKVDSESGSRKPTGGDSSDSKDDAEKMGIFDDVDD
ncbi:MAG: hypothetical protein K2W94_01470 [Alphaproteobacteria bacterium]|nr:hypothetical protein [Alphaproteobacteria bacterium]